MRTDSITTDLYSAEASKMRNTVTKLPQEKKENLKIVLVGNPNVGKSLFFNYLSGMYVEVSNFPGTTVSISSAPYKNNTVYDTPGVYGVSSFNDEEKAARDMILEADIVLNIVNSLHLERDLFLTQQLIEMGKRITVLLNFSDEVKSRNIRIDAAKLSSELGVEVIATSATKKTNFDKLDFAISSARIGKHSPDIYKALNPEIISKYSKAYALIIAEGDEIISEKLGYPCGSGDDREIIYVARRTRVNQIVSEVEYEDTSKGKFFNIIGRLALNPYTGVPLLAVVLVVLYFFIGDFVAQRLVGFTEKTIGKSYFEYYTKKYVSKFTPVDITVNVPDDKGGTVVKNFIFRNNIDSEVEKRDEFSKISRESGATTGFFFPNPLARLLFGEFGVVSMTITYLVFLLLPLVVAFYFVMAILEDSGYLPRLATMMDKTLTRIGLNGRAVIPILLGFGCVTMATITTRLLGSEREKTIVTAILQFVIPCSAQLAVIAVLAGSAGTKAMLIYGAVIFTVLVVLSTILDKLLPGNSTPLLIDLPIMRLPQIENVFKKTFYRSFGFMKEAAGWFFLGALFIGVLEITGLLIKFQDFLAPITVSWLKLPREAATAFVMGTVRRDFGAAGLFSLALTPMQITVSLVVITLFVPCIASAMVMMNERGWKEGTAIWVGAWVFAFIIGGITAQIII